MNLRYRDLPKVALIAVKRSHVHIIGIVLLLLLIPLAGAPIAYDWIPTVGLLRMYLSTALTIGILGPLVWAPIFAVIFVIHFWAALDELSNTESLK